MTKQDPNRLQDHVRRKLTCWDGRYWHQIAAFEPAGGNEDPVRNPLPILHHQILLEPALFQAFLDELDDQSLRDRPLPEAAEAAVDVALAILAVIDDDRQKKGGKNAQTVAAPSLDELRRQIVDCLLPHVPADKWRAYAGGWTVAYLNGWEPTGGVLRVRPGQLAQVARGCLRDYFCRVIDRTLKTLTKEVEGFRSRLAQNPHVGDHPDRYFAQRLLNRFVARKDFCTCYIPLTGGTVDRDWVLAEIETLPSETDRRDYANRKSNAYRKVIGCILHHGLGRFDPQERSRPKPGKNSAEGDPEPISMPEPISLPRFLERAINGNQGVPLGDPRSFTCQIRGEGFGSGMLYDALRRKDPREDAEGMEPVAVDLQLVAVARYECTKPECMGERKPGSDGHLTLKPRCPVCGRDFLAEEDQILRTRGWLILTSTCDGGFEERRVRECSDSECRNLYPAELDHCPLTRCKKPRKPGRGQRSMGVYFWVGDAPPPQSGPDPICTPATAPDIWPALAAAIRKKWPSDWKHGLAAVIEQEQEPDLRYLLLSADTLDAEENWENWNDLHAHLRRKGYTPPSVKELPQKFYDGLSKELRTLAAACLGRRKP